MSLDPGKGRNHPFWDVARQVEDWAAKGGDCFQKFTCARCGARQMIDEANKFYTRGQCEECSHITDLLIAGCNYMLILSPPKDPTSNGSK